MACGGPLKPLPQCVRCGSAEACRGPVREEQGKGLQLSSLPAPVLQPTPSQYAAQQMQPTPSQYAAQHLQPTPSQYAAQLQ